MEPGDVVLAYSDGAIEAMSPTGEFFGLDRLVATLAAASGDPQAVVDRVLDALDAFTRQRQAYDDVTLIALGCRAGPEGGDETRRPADPYLGGSGEPAPAADGTGGMETDGN